MKQHRPPVYEEVRDEPDPKRQKSSSEVEEESEASAGMLKKRRHLRNSRSRVFESIVGNRVMHGACSLPVTPFRIQIATSKMLYSKESSSWKWSIVPFKTGRLLLTLPKLMCSR